MASYAPTLPAGYFARSSRNEFGEPCVGLHCERDGWLSDHDCEADAAFAAQEHAEQGMSEAEKAESYAVESEMLDSIFREVSRRYDADLAADHPKNRAVRLALRAIDTISVPVSGKAA